MYFLNLKEKKGYCASNNLHRLFSKYGSYSQSAKRLLVFLLLELTNHINGHTSTTHLSIEPIDSACVHPRVRWLKVMCRDSLASLPQSEAAPRTVWCPAIEHSTSIVCLTSEGEWAGCTVIGGRAVKGGQRGVGDSDGHLENRWGYSITCS